MFGSIGGFEMVVLAIIGLLVFGPRRLPEIGRTLGKAMMEFRRASMELRASIEKEVNLEEVKEATRGIRQSVQEVIPAMPAIGRMPGGGDLARAAGLPTLTTLLEQSGEEAQPAAEPSVSDAPESTSGAETPKGDPGGDPPVVPAPKL